MQGIYKLKQKLLPAGAMLLGAVLFASGLSSRAENDASTANSPASPPAPAQGAPLEEAPSSQLEKLNAADSIRKAEVELNRKRFAEAKTIVKKALAQCDEKTGLYLELYKISVASNDWSDASLSLEKVFELEPAREKDLMLEYAQALLKLRRNAKAKTAFNKALAFGRNKEDAYRGLIKIAQLEKDDPEAQIQMKEYLKLAPNDGDMHFEYANLLYKAGNLKESILEYKIASDKRPHDSYGHERLAYLLLCQKDFDGSINAYKKAIAVRPSEARLKQALSYAISQKRASQQQAPASK
ncbi:MAG: hypothetical protein K2X27_17645 [Candidatus Obscuribacterales bacterium]|nr:hypothetical protein [Candidatus Obscuribacterales bacterium]